MQKVKLRRQNEETYKKTPHEAHVVRAVREIYPDLKEAKHGDLDLQSAIKLGKRYYEQVIDNERSGEIDVEPSKSKYQKTRGWKEDNYS